MAACRIELFGGPIVRLGVDAITKFETRKTALLLGVLATEPGRSWNRNAICEILWALEDPEVARTRLRQAVSALRRGLGDAADFIEADRIDLRLHPDVASDTDEFERMRKRSLAAEDPAERAGLLARAAALVRDDFLPGFTEDWATIQRDHYRAARLEAIESAARLFVDLGQQTEAIDAYAFILRQDPLREDVARRLMSLYAEAGLAPNALRVFKELGAALHTQIGFDPAPETAALAESIRQAAPRATRPIEAPSTPARTEHAFPELPEAQTPLFGREDEIAQMLDLLAPGSSVRLVTLTGIGGIGKTRLSLEIAKQLRNTYSGAVWQVPLETVDTPDDLGTVLLEGTGLKRLGTDPPIQQLVQHLATVQGVLVLDNFEQIVEGGAEVIASLIKRCPGLRILVTSRVQLNLAAEREVVIAPLPLPREEGIEDCPSVQLFLERCRAIRPSFTVGPAVGQLVQRLEGIPLALTLAAARAQVLSAEQMLEQIERRFEFIAAQRRDLPARHRTMAAAIDWSVQALDEPTRAFFARLSVFRGGFNLEMASEVAAVDGCRPLDSVQHLRERSLILVEESEVGLRYRMLETIREYASGLMDDTSKAHTQRKHANAIAAFSDKAEESIRGSEQGKWLKILDAERPNILTALDWACEHEPESAARIVAGFWMYWHIRGRFHEGRTWGKRVVDSYHPEVPTLLLAKALNGYGVMCDRCSDSAAGYEALSRSIAISEHLGETKRVSDALNNLGNLLFNGGRYDEARDLHSRALALAREAGDIRTSAMISANLGNIACAMMDFGAAQEFLDSALRTNRETGNRHWEANNLTSMGIVAMSLDDLQGASTLFAESLALKRELGHPMGIALTLTMISHLERRRGDLAAASHALAEATRIVSSLESPALLASVQEAGARVAVLKGRLEDAALLYGAGHAIRTRHSVTIHLFERAEHETRIEELKTALGEDAYDAAFSAGERMSAAQTIAILLSVAEETP